MAELVVDNVVKRYGRETALDKMSFEVDRGEFFCLLGPSAAGKTTTLRAISGLEALQGGRVHFKGEDVTTAPVQNRGMAMIFQTFALYPHLTIRQNFHYPLERTGVGRAEVKRRVGEVAELLRVVHTLDRKPSTLSGGEQQRVAIGRAIISQPSLLLLDEPLTNLDAKLRHEMRAEFKRLHRELGMTMLYATPDQLEALTMGQRIAVIRDGKVEQVEAPRTLYETPGNAYVASMVGAPTMNLVPASVRWHEDGLRLNLPFGELDAERWKTVLETGDDFLFGIRPHDISIDGLGDHQPQFRARVHLSEPLGDVTILDLRIRETLLKIILPEERAAEIPVGSDLDITLSLDDAHLFHRETGVRVQ
ncbi:MAG: ABC transporter ATP-binding protein [Geminicoccaceae bacterium]